MHSATLPVLDCDPNLPSLPLQTAYDIRFGARPLRRWLEQHVVTELSRLIVAGELLDGGAVSIDVDT